MIVGDGNDRAELHSILVVIYKWRKAARLRLSRGLDSRTFDEEPSADLSAFVEMTTVEKISAMKQTCRNQ